MLLGKRRGHTVYKSVIKFTHTFNFIILKFIPVLNFLVKGENYKMTVNFPSYNGNGRPVSIITLPYLLYFR